jgi:hypothetical protein
VLARVVVALVFIKPYRPDQSGRTYWADVDPFVTLLTDFMLRASIDLSVIPDER